MAIELEDDHYQSHATDPDPDCTECRETWDYFSEAVRIIEGDSLLIVSRKHLEAAVERVEEREAEILRLRDLLGEASTELTLLSLRDPMQMVAKAISNRIANVLAVEWPKKKLLRRCQIQKNDSLNAYANKELSKKVSLSGVFRARKRIRGLSAG